MENQWAIASNYDFLIAWSILGNTKPDLFLMHKSDEDFIFPLKKSNPVSKSFII